MNKFTIITALSLILAGCSAYQIKADVDEGKFRFVNFEKERGKQFEYIHLMCLYKRPIEWNLPRQYQAGNHQLWVKAQIYQNGMRNSEKNAFVKFDISLDAGLSYKLNRSFEDNKISIWIEEEKSKNIVSEIITTELIKPLFVEKSLRTQQCETGTI
ncbi:hypothetical protein [Colwellia hornerae]|uniref:Lipoprotein n=1 Tax=Colwellia hornerae TaxID=89402 RepID=A0A5C6QHB4_9GAMM|nr:hypothetical protein [Colwellia hornerae]TWX52431.1 hypothetical protein ESZ28_12260 [Colwellia hornerae]TWX58260.1 hypothetical protein ESZ26_12225 [Colwellia hornerae]TWX68395.1 hypothetical protein ESZ27_07230 [Colwellia hornerae]